MQILAIEKELAPIDPQRHREVLRAEAACVWELKKSGVIRDIWFTIRGRLAVVMLECSSEEIAEQHLAALPLVREGLIAFDVMALGSYDGFDRLIAAESQMPNQSPAHNAGAGPAISGGASPFNRPAWFEKTACARPRVAHLSGQNE